MTKNKPNTEEILDAIKNMMSEKSTQYDQDLPKDVIELTDPINEKEKIENPKIDILELSNPIIDEKNVRINELQNRAEKNENYLDDEKIKEAVRNAIDSMSQSKLDEIINEELTKIIQERLKSTKIIISKENKNN